MHQREDAEILKVPNRRVRFPSSSRFLGTPDWLYLPEPFLTQRCCLMSVLTIGDGKTVKGNNRNG